MALVENHQVLLWQELAKNATPPVVRDLLPEQIQPEIVQEALDVEAWDQTVALPQL